MTKQTKIRRKPKHQPAGSAVDADNADPLNGSLACKITINAPVFIGRRT